MTLELRLTSIKDIPKNWDIEKIENVILEAKSGFASGKRDETGVIQLRMNSIDTQGWINSGGYVKVPVPKDVKEYLLKKGDVLFNNTNSAELVGKTAIFNGEIPECVYSNHLTRLRVNPRKVISEWLLLVFMRYWQQGVFRALRHQHVHQAGINQGDLLNVKIPVPNLEEQRKIVDIFLCVDDAIRQVELAIAKTERLKKGSIHKLLSEGLGHKEFKETRIGKIPKKWEVIKLKSIAKKKSDIVAGPFGSNLKVCDYTSYGVPIIRLQNIERNQFINKDIKYTSQKKAEELSYHSYQPGDIILAKLGDPIGKTCIVPSFMKAGIVVADVVRIRPSPEKAVTLFLEYVLNSSMCFYQLRKQTIGSTRPRVNMSQVRNLRIPLPPLDEQQRIADILSTIDHKFGLEKRRKGKLEHIKKGLMNDLLAGRKRVKVAM